MGELEPLLLDPANPGFIRKHKKLRIGYFAQHQIDALNPRASAYDHVVELMPEATEAQRRARLANFGLGTKNAETPAGDLSGGEKARLLFSLIGFNRPHLLVLDEPANHLDIDSRAQLIRSLNNYEGAVIVISHDRNLLEAVVDRLWLVDSGKVESFEGSLEDYRTLQLEKTKTERKQKPKEENSRKRHRQDRAKALKEIAPLKRRAEQLEKEIELAQTKLKTIDMRLSSEDLFTTNPEEAVQLGQSRAKTAELLETLELDWLTALETYEHAREQEGLD